MTHKPPLTIATAQPIIHADVRRNGQTIRQLMHQAHQQGADLIHFPEGAMSGYVKAQIRSWDGVDWDTLRAELQQTAALAVELGIWAVIGANHRLTPPHRPHNSLYICSPCGQQDTRYDKRWCSHSELTDWYTPGQDPCVIEVGGWRFGCALCIEIQFPEVFMDYANAGVDAILFSAYADNPVFGIQAQGYAASHNVWFSLSAPQQVSHALSSRVIGPDGLIQATCKPSQTPALCFATLDEGDPRWKVPLQYAKPWRQKARGGEIYRARWVDDPRSTNKTQI